MYAILHIPSGEMLLKNTSDCPAALFYDSSKAERSLSLYVKDWAKSTLLSKEQSKTRDRCRLDYTAWADECILEMSKHAIDEYTVIEVEESS